MQQTAETQSSFVRGVTPPLFIRGLSPEERHLLRMLAAAANMSVNAYVVAVLRAVLAGADPRAVSLVAQGSK